MGGLRAATAAMAAAVCVLVVLTGCSQGSTPAPPPATESSTPSSTPTPEPPPELDPEGDAADNLEFFDFVNESLLAQNAAPGGRGHIDALVAAGFDKAAMEVTVDTTTVSVAADNIEFSVLFKGECLVGQSGLIGYTSAVVPVLSTGKCFVGITRPIDW